MSREPVYDEARVGQKGVFFVDNWCARFAVGKAGEPIFLLFLKYCSSSSKCCLVTLPPRLTDSFFFFRRFTANALSFGVTWL